jgi:hypothetical protein
MTQDPHRPRWRLQRREFGPSFIELLEYDGRVTVQSLWVEDWTSLRRLAEEIILATDRPEPASSFVMDLDPDAEPRA